tara:strand:+ start:58 stop:690 length:633 start_codon:yes stop_codon:yes gene_type:complete
MGYETCYEVFEVRKETPIIDYKVEKCERGEIKDFIEKWHYSHNMNGVISTYCFKLLDGDKLIGAAVFGWLAMANQWKKYTDSKEKLIELRRLCCIDDTMKNTESYFISRCIKWLKRNTKIEKIVSYADLEFNHEGIIYKATSFKLIGKTAKGRVILWNGKRYHDKTIRTFYNGDLKPYAKRLKTALESGKASYKKTEGKNIYLKTIRKVW